MNIFRFTVPAAAQMVLLGLVTLLQGFDPPSVVVQSADQGRTSFLRLDNNEDGSERALQTSITRYQASGPNDGVTVDLVATIHIGEREYYKQLNELFESYDVVLYELVAPKGVVPSGEQDLEGNPIAFLQKSAQSFLGLQSQVERIDYKKSNFVHADLTPDEIAKKMDERGESALTITLSTLADVIRQQNLAAREQSDESLPTEMDDILQLLEDPLKLKRFVARQFADPQALEKSLGQSLGQMLITDRNEAAMKVLNQQVAQGRKKIAIFYGAGHMNDFHTRLEQDLKLSQQSQKWLDAWDLTSSSPEANNHPMRMLLELLRELDQ